jgi:hypothetical protein
MFMSSTASSAVYALNATTSGLGNASVGPGIYSSGTLGMMWNSSGKTYLGNGQIQALAGSLQLQESSAGATVFQANGSPSVTTLPNLKSLSFTSSTLTPTAPTTVEFSITPPSTASASSLGALIQFDAVTLTMTGGTANTGTTNAYVYVNQETLTDATAVTISRYGTLTIKGAGVAAGSVTITNNYALDVQAGVSNLAGGANIGTLTGILIGTSGVVSIATIDSSLSFTSSTLSLPSVGPGAVTTGGTGKYVQSVQTDAKGRVLAVTAISGTESYTKTWSCYCSVCPNTLPDSSTASTVIVPGDTGATVTSQGLISEPSGVGVASCVAAVYGTSVSVPLYPLDAQYNSGTFQGMVSLITATGSGTGTLEFSLWVCTGSPGIPANMTQIASMTQNFTSSTTTIVPFSTTWTATTPATQPSLFMAVRRTDTNTGLRVFPIFFTGSATLLK